MPFFSANGISPYNKTSGGASSGPSTDPDADAWIAAGSVTDPTEKAAVNQFALDLKGTGSTPNNSDVWNSLHWINLVSATSLAASLNDLKGGYNLTAYNSPTWSPNGITGNGSNMYLLTSYSAANNGSTLDSNSFGCAVRTVQTNTGASFMGVRNASTIPYNAMVESGGSRYYGNNSSFAQVAGAGAFPDGNFVNNRTSPSNFDIYFDNVLDFTGNVTTNALASSEMGVLCQNNAGVIGGFSDMEFTVAFEGEGLTANQMEDLNTSINTLNANIIAGGRAAIPFIMTIDTTQAGSASDTFVLPFSSIGSYNCVVDWGDSTSNTITSYNDPALTHVYSTPGTYQISISWAFGGLYFNNGGDKLKLSSVDQWGTNVFASMANAFYGCSNMTGNFTDYPNLGTITSLKDTFRAATLFNGDISSWDVSNVTVFNTMFYQATNFNSNIDSWNLKSTGSITMNNMFQFCTNFNQPLNSWNVSRVISFYETFANCPAFNQNLNSWDVSNVTTMYRMFLSCTNFGLSGIGGDISSWTPTSCTIMERMLQSASNFNSDISGWNVSSVTNMRVMLYATTAFDQNIGSWNISNVTDFNDFMGLQTPSTFSASNLDAIYNGWDSRAVQTPIVITFGSAKHTAASSTARASLVSKGWTITDGGI
jgi:surface protein